MRGRAVGGRDGVEPKRCPDEEVFVHKLSDILRVETAASPAGRTAESLRASVGPLEDEAIDFDAMEGILRHVYNDNRQAYIADPSAGTFRQLVEAAESCQVSIIHPGRPRNPNEPGLEELIERAKVFE